jgi:hypothetical protein
MGEWVMRTSRLVPIAAAVILVVNLLAVSAPSASAAQSAGNELCVAVSGGTVQNATVLDIAADGGTAIGDASGGNGNLAAAVGNDRERDNGNNNRRTNNNRNNRNDWSAESVQSLEDRLLQTDTASSGNGGVATASGNGGVVSIGDINSGGNAGNAILVGDTHCPGAAPKPSGGGGGGYAAPSGGGRGGKVSKLPKTGIGVAGVGASGSLILAFGALGMTGLSLGFRLDRRDFRASGR